MEILNPFPLTFFFLYLPFISLSTTTPDDKIFLNCGSSETINSHGRSWTGDTGSKFISTDDQTKTAPTSKNPDQSGASVDQFLYSTARVSRSEFSYSFPLAPGPKFIRLHFYPTSYLGDFDRTKAFFSVKAGPFTLLSNFSASLTADAESSSMVMKEFCIYILDDQKLNLTFTPTNSSSDSFAFVNGIEVVPIPEKLFFSTDDDTGYIEYIAEQNPYQIAKSSALETIVRLNVGGSEILPEKDTGMFRWWKPDDSYLVTPKVLAMISNDTIHLDFTKIPSYSAPEKVYRTARTTGGYKYINNRHNLTWEIQVDAGFTYFLRLHFCEFQVSQTYERFFNIYIAEQVADLTADVIKWAGAKGVPVYQNYAVTMGEEEGTNSKKRNLSIDLHSAKDWQSGYSDAILNGIELFKLSSIYNLAGPNPDPIPKPVTSLTHDHKNSKKLQILVPTIVSTAAVGIIALLVTGIALRRRRQINLKKMDPSSVGKSWWSPFFVTPNSTKSRDSRNSSLPSDLCHQFSLAEIKAATKNFDDAFIIGSGGFGNVYKGYINVDEAIPVAIKRLNPESQQGAREFMNEIGMLSQLRHLHLVSLIGYCHEDREMILVYDYMAHGTLREHLYQTDNPPLPWKQRLQICIDAARGLLYLHTGATQTIIHRDIKTTNILLDEKWMAKVSDFGISRLGPTTLSKTHVSTVVKGTFGYLDPEYYRRQQLSDKSDVYSFGVVLLEILCGRPPINQTKENKQVSLVQWVQSCYSKEMLHHIVDPNLDGQISPQCLEKYVEIALACVKDNGSHRPAMKDIAGSLEFALQLQMNTEDRIFQASPGEDTNYESFTTSDERSSTCTGESRSVISAGTVFSEIATPKER